MSEFKCIIFSGFMEISKLYAVFIAVLCIYRSFS